MTAAAAAEYTEGLMNAAETEMAPSAATAPARKRASIHTLGCRLNQSESNLLANALRAEGYELTPFGAPADLGIINTCTVTREADAKSRQAIRAFIRRNPHAFTAVIGCYSQMGYKQLAEIEGVDLIVGNQEKLNVLAYAAQGKTGQPLIVRDRIERDDFTIEAGASEPGLTRPNLKIQDGCNFMCSFCIIPFARGRARSRDVANLMEEARRLVARGARELVLTGVNIGLYRHKGRDIVDVVEALNGVSGLDRIRISSIEPTTIPERLFAFMRDPDHALTPYLHIPLQSGSDCVLSIMKRKYTAAEFLEFIRAAAAAVPGLCIGTDVLAGSPGETDEDFEATRTLLEESPIAYAHVFKYSEREGTPAARRADQVDPETRNRRSAVLRRVSAEKKRRYMAAHVGQTLPVLFERMEDGLWVGHTGNYIRVAARSTRATANTLRPVRLEAIRGDFMIGTADDA